MKSVKYFYKAYDNRDKEEKDQGYADITLISAASQSLLTDHLVSESIKRKGEMKIDFGLKSLEVNRKHCPKVFNVVDPLTGEHHNEISIDELYKSGQFRQLYEELSNAVGDISVLKEGLKKK